MGQARGAMEVAAKEMDEQRQQASAMLEAAGERDLIAEWAAVDVKSRLDSDETGADSNSDGGGYSGALAAEEHRAFWDDKLLVTRAPPLKSCTNCSTI